jgi:hypothetical protein
MNSCQVRLFSDFSLRVQQIYELFWPLRVVISSCKEYEVMKVVYM